MYMHMYLSISIYLHIYIYIYIYVCMIIHSRNKSYQLRGQHRVLLIPCEEYASDMCESLSFVCIIGYYVFGKTNLSESGATGSIMTVCHESIITQYDVRKITHTNSPGKLPCTMWLTIQSDVDYNIYWSRHMSISSDLAINLAYLLT